MIKYSTFVLFSIKNYEINLSRAILWLKLMTKVGRMQTSDADNNILCPRVFHAGSKYDELTILYDY